LLGLLILVGEVLYYFEFISGSIEMELIYFLVVLAAITKSAQIPFSS
jgi:NADH:ubiquinone oxidoreductase subunit 5 (subunit L)/multisubunit Na+/H+ antiporter MnhA subunit